VNNRSVILILVFVGLIVAGVALNWRQQPKPRASATPTPAVRTAPSAPPGGFLAGLLRRPWSRAAPERPRIGAIRLQGLILSKRNPVAMINCTPVCKGETAPVPVPHQYLNVQCVDITGDGVQIKSEDAGLVTLRIGAGPVASLD
jgi:hypothetical protein